jgi:hypothetical protein
MLKPGLLAIENLIDGWMSKYVRLRLLSVFPDLQGWRGSWRSPATETAWLIRLNVQALKLAAESTINVFRINFAKVQMVPIMSWCVALAAHTHTTRLQ